MNTLCLHTPVKQRPASAFLLVYPAIRKATAPADVSLATPCNAGGAPHLNVKMRDSGCEDLDSLVFPQLQQH